MEKILQEKLRKLINIFKTGNVLVKIDYSSLNYKDGMILKNKEV